MPSANRRPYDRHKHLPTLVFAVLALLQAGCLELETRIAIRPDGSARITERIRFSQQLLDLDAEQPKAERVSELLTRAAAQKRLAEMGQGVKLISHEVRDAPGGAREAVNVFETSDVNGFRYASPFPAYLDFAENNLVEVKLEPVYDGTWWGRRAGDIAVSLRPVKKPQPAQRIGDDDPPPPGPPPRDVQLLRDLQPVFADVARGLRLKLTVEGYGPLRATGFGHRGRKTGGREADLIDFEFDDLDNLGQPFLANEEVMLDLLQGKIGSRNVIEHTKNFANNHTLPVFLPAGSAYAGIRDEIYFPPSRELFAKYFDGKMITFAFEKGPDRTRPATYDEIGFRPVNQPTPKNDN